MVRSFPLSVGLRFFVGDRFIVVDFFGGAGGGFAFFLAALDFALVFGLSPALLDVEPPEDFEPVDDVESGAGAPPSAASPEDGFSLAKSMTKKSRETNELPRVYSTGVYPPSPTRWPASTANSFGKSFTENSDRILTSV
jgi:hypothetical protein